MWRGIAAKIYDLTLGKLRLILENKIIATDTAGLAVTDAKIASWFIRDRLQSKNIFGLIWENILNTKKNVLLAVSAAKESLLNAQMAIKLWLSKAAYPHLQAEYMLEFRKNFLRKMSIKQLIWKNILAIKENIKPSLEVSTATYEEFLSGLVNKRVNTILNIDKLKSTGFVPRTANDALAWCVTNYGK